MREIAETTVSPSDLKEDLIHSLQKYVEVDEAEPEEPLIGTSNATVYSGDTEVTSERMTEEDLLKGIEGLALVPREEPEKSCRKRTPISAKYPNLNFRQPYSSYQIFTANRVCHPSASSLCSVMAVVV